jgi:hypothetical protein
VKYGHRRFKYDAKVPCGKKGILLFNPFFSELYTSKLPLGGHGIGTGQMRNVVQYLVRARELFLLQNVQMGLGPHPAPSNSVSTRGTTPASKAA